MTFDRTWVLLLLIVPVAWVVWEWRGESRRTALLLKAAAIMAILLAIAEPKVPPPTTTISKGRFSPTPLGAFQRKISSVLRPWLHRSSRHADEI